MKALHLIPKRRSQTMRILSVILVLTMLLTTLLIYAQATPPEYEEITVSQRDLSSFNLPASSLYHNSTVKPDTWVFTDGLGRKSLTNADVGAPREDRTVAMFYWSWHAPFSKLYPPFNTQAFIDQNTAAGIPLEEYIHDYNYEGWGTGYGCFWNEPIYGFYSTEDQWVLRRHAEMLSNAGVDVIFFDTTNGKNSWPEGYKAVYAAWNDAQIDGVDTPKVSNLFPFSASEGTAIMLREMYDVIYRDGNYRSLWFYWDGKPMVAAHGKNSLNLADPTDKDISDFFTFRAPQPSYFLQKGEYKAWGWLDAFPQAEYYATGYDKRDGIIEQMTVGVSQNANYKFNLLSSMNADNVMGRSYTSTDPDRYLREGDEASKWGYNFAEQWENALVKDPKVVFVTGWNEWNISRISSPWPENHIGVKNSFPDQFNDEYSRDIEPSRGALQDHYYYQLVNYVRRYKGVEAMPLPSAPAAIDLAADEAQWQSVEPYFAAQIGNTDDRDHDGYVGTHYSDYSGRNDIIGSQVSRDAENLWFHVECAADITPYTDKLWMNLYIDVETTEETAGWNSFDFVLNKTAPTDKTAVLEKFTDGYQSEKVADVEYAVNGRYMTVKIPKSALGISGDLYTVNFAWTDNVHDVVDTGTAAENGDVIYNTFSGDILDFYTSGDVAPGGRFKFSYIVNDEKVEEETTVADDGTQEPETPAETPAGTSNETKAPEDTTDAVVDKGCQSAVVPAASLLMAGAACIALRKKGIRKEE